MAPKLIAGSERAREKREKQQYQKSSSHHTCYKHSQTSSSTLALQPNDSDNQHYHNQYNHCRKYSTMMKGKEPSTATAYSSSHEITSTTNPPPQSSPPPPLTSITIDPTTTKTVPGMTDEESGLDNNEKSLFRRMKSGIKYQWQIILANPFIGYISIFIILVLCGIGLGIIYAIRFNHIEDKKEQSLKLAQETGDFFSTQLDQALFPLFSISQFGSELEMFHPLNEQIGPAFQDGSTPFIDAVRRNVTGICDDPTLVERYNKIARTIKQNANMPGVLVQIELAPQGVLCLNYPIVNTEDFPPDSGIVMDSRGAIGLDLVTLKDNQFVQQTLQRRQDLLSEQQEQTATQPQGQQRQVVIQGPITLEQCNDKGGGEEDGEEENEGGSFGQECFPAVKQAFIARLAVHVPGTYTQIDDVVYPDAWGHAAVLLNWDELVLRSGMYETFDERGLGFQLTRTDTIIKTTSTSTTPQGEEIEEVVVLAETSQFQYQRTQSRNLIRTVTVALDTTDNEWEMTIAYPVEEKWVFWMILLVVIMSLLVALLVQTLLVQQQQYKTMERKYLDDVAQPQKLRLKMFLEDESTQHFKANKASSSSSNNHALAATSAAVEEEEEKMLTAKPIADLYPKVTLMFADIAGFTAWSSERSPALIFSLLQNIFFAFDKLAEKHGIFPVDKIGDCYVAATGFPNSQEDHAVRMARFARECMAKVPEVTKRLEQHLGPDTGDLRVRFGLHSGPVTAGVMAGDKKSRVQLVGETMITAARIESLGKQNHIHLSEATAQLLRDAGKQRWVAQRADMVHAKGIGVFQTYWLITKQQHGRRRRNRSQSQGRLDSLSSFSGEDSEAPPPGFEIVSTGGGSELWGDIEDGDGNSYVGDGIVSDKTARLVEWHVSFMVGLIKHIVARRGTAHKGKSSKKRELPLDTSATLTYDTVTILEEVKEVISLPKFNKQDLKNVSDIESIIIPNEAINQLRDYVSEIAMYYDNHPFHNFEHASHVTMAVHKLLNRISNNDDVNYQRKNASKIASELHDYTFGITSDPLTHFAVVMSALIHDVDHHGVPNAQLAKEDPALAEMYHNQSIAEQNSVDLAWKLFMEPKYTDLHSCIFSNQSELLRFRQIIVNSVIATDIFDKELKGLRDLRWQKAFHPEKFPEMSTTHSDPTTSGTDDPDGSKWTDTNRKATIVIEHIIQASDVAHTMQHWHVYVKWNEKLFQEMYLAWKSDRSIKSPYEGWYKGELWFFDNYIIPLAQKLAECGVFGVASDECLHNALQNRSEWESRGESILEEWVDKCQKLFG